MFYLIVILSLGAITLGVMVGHKSVKQDEYIENYEKKVEAPNYSNRLHRTDYVRNELYNKWKTKNNLFSNQELQFYKKLLNHTSNRDLFVHSKVRIADLVQPKYKLNNSEFMKVFLKLSQKHVDFVITDNNGSILCVIELDGSSHNYGRTVENDRFKNQFFKDIGMPLVRFQNYSHHNLSKIDNFIGF